MTILKNIKEYTANVKRELKEEVEGFSIAPSLAIIQVGAVEASNRYIRNKIKDCQEVGINAHHYAYEESITTDELALEVKDLAEHYNGIIVQLPLPVHIDVAAINDAIPKDRDIDGFTAGSLFDPATPSGIIDYLEYCGFPFEGSEVLVLGRSDIVGKPMARMLTAKDCTVTLVHSKSKHIWSHIQDSDLIITAVGKAGFLNCYSMGDRPVVDVGINFNEEGKMVGDCFNTENRNVTPVPGGVGLLTRVALLKNVIKAYKVQNGY